ncbi:response regulator [Aequorivita flava]|uniref:histidine kinase n=1 Tax=Aequorivita flava TaxID=3114371 RepID=A0AB35YL00_9FLAO
MLTTKPFSFIRNYKIVTYSLLIFLFFTTISLIGYYTIINEQRDFKLKQLDIVGSLTYQDFRKIIYHNIHSLEGLRDRIVESDGRFQDYIKSDSERIIKQNQSIKFVFFVDSTGIINFVTPLEANRKALNLDISKLIYRYPGWLANSKDTLTNITPWLDLTQSGKAFLVDVPVYYNNTFQGTVSAGMDFKSQFDNISSKQNIFSVLIKDETGKTFYSYNTPNRADFNEKQIFERKLKPFADRVNGAWKFEFMYNSKSELYATPLQNIILALSIFGSLLIGLLGYFFLLGKSQIKKDKLINHKLNALNEELKLERQRAEDASMAKTQFLSHMSHEIRTPLSAILSISEILEGKKLLASEKEFLKLMQNSSRTLLNLVNNILHIDKIESGKMELSEEVFNPFITLKQILEIYSQAAKMKGLEVHSNFNEIKKSKVVTGDVSRTEQIFTNLISNAVKFTNAGFIKVFYEEKEVAGQLYINFDVTDTGIGIDPSQKEAIFERFKQLDFGITKKHQGSGLGLAITKMLIDFMQGNIKVESKLGKGTTFKVSLQFPIVAKEDRIENNRKYRSLSHLNVLIVDDNMLNCRILEKILSKKNIKPDIAKDGDAALLECLSRQYDLIFMDVHMPGRDGFEIVQYLRKIGNKAIILGFSADATREAVERGIKSGMNDYLTKPIEQETLFTILGRYFL